MIIYKGQKTRPVELVKKYPKYECLKFDTLGQAARFFRCRVFIFKKLSG